MTIGRTPLWSATVIVATCGEAEDRGPASAVRDSAGVRIIESAAPVWGAGEQWRLSAEPTVEIRGDGDDTDEMPLDPASVFRAGEEIVVADGISVGLHRLLVYDAAGRFLRTIGRGGQGPCEFAQLWWAQPYRGDSIAAYDYDDHDISIFAPDGSCGREVRFPQWHPPIERGTYGYSAGVDGAFDDGSFLAQPYGYLDVSAGPGPAWYRHAFLRTPPDGVTYDSLGLFEIAQAYWTGTSTGEYPFGAYGNRIVAGDGFYFGRGDVFEIRRYDPDGTLTDIIRRQFEPQLVTARDRAEYTDLYVEMIRNASSDHGGDEAALRARARIEAATFAPAKPAFSDLVVDSDGNLWVQEYRHHLAIEAAGALPPVRWSVFDPEGRWLGDVEMAGRFTPKTIADGEVLGVWKDETGIAHVQAYRLQRD